MACLLREAPPVRADFMHSASENSIESRVVDSQPIDYLEKSAINYRDNAQFPFPESGCYPPPILARQ